MHGTRSVMVRGIGRLPRVQQLGLIPDVELPMLTMPGPKLSEQANDRP